MERSATNADVHAMLRSEPHFSEKTYDTTILVAAGCFVIGAMIAVCALAVWGAVDPDTLANMVAFP